MHFLERQVLVTLSMGLEYHTNFNITVLTDERLSYEQRARPMGEVWKEFGMRPSKGGSGITQFLVEIQSVFERSVQVLWDTLNSIDKLVQASVSVPRKTSILATPAERLTKDS